MYIYAYILKYKNFLGNEIKKKIERILRDFGCDLMMDESSIQRTEHNTLCKSLDPQVNGKLVNEVPELPDLVNRCSKLLLKKLF